MATNNDAPAGEKTPGEALEVAVREVYDAAAKATSKAHAITRDSPDPVTTASVAAALPHLRAAVSDLNEALYAAMQYAVANTPDRVTVEGPEPGRDDPAYSLQDEDLDETDPEQWGRLTAGQLRALPGGEYLFFVRRQRLTYPVPTVIADGREEIVVVGHYTSRPRRGPAVERVSVTLKSSEWAEYDDSMIEDDGVCVAEDYGMEVFGPQGQGPTLAQVQADYREAHGEGRRGER